MSNTAQFGSPTLKGDHVLPASVVSKTATSVATYMVSAAFGSITRALAGMSGSRLVPLPEASLHVAAPPAPMLPRQTCPVPKFDITRKIVSGAPGRVLMSQIERGGSGAA